MPEKLTKNVFIERSNKIHNNLYDYSKVDYVNTKTKVCIIDPDYGEFWQRPERHMVGDSHPARSNENRKKTNLEKYGVENPFQSEEIKGKIKNANLEKYGVENPQQNKNIKEKTKKN
jgi:hypothetical protein